MDFLHSVLVKRESLSASALRVDDLPVNPLSLILLSFRWQDGAAVGNTAFPVRDMLSFISNVAVLFKGQAIFSMSLADLLAFSCFFPGLRPSVVNMLDGANQQHWLTVPLCMGRRPYDVMECFPAVRKGELQLQITSAAAVGTVDSPTLLVETVELLGATPQRFIKATTISKTPTATGEHDVDLPIGNPILGCLLFSTTTPTGTTDQASIGELVVKRDNVEFGYSRTVWASLHNWTLSRYPKSLVTDRHFHNQAVNTDVVTGEQTFDNADLEKYAWLDFDPHKDGQWMLETAGHARVHLRITQEPAADAIRVVPAELVELQAAAAGGA